MVTANRTGTGAEPEHKRTQAHGGRDTCRGAAAIVGHFPRTFRAGGTRADGLPRSVRREERLAAANQRHSEAHLSRSVRQRMPVMREMGSEGRRTHQGRIFRPPLLCDQDGHCECVDQIDFPGKFPGKFDCSHRRWHRVCRLPKHPLAIVVPPMPQATCWLEADAPDGQVIRLPPREYCMVRQFTW